MVKKIKCWILGHKYWSGWIRIGPGWDDYRRYKMNYCIRCGEPMPDGIFHKARCYSRPQQGQPHE